MTCAYEGALALAASLRCRRLQGKKGAHPTIGGKRPPEARTGAVPVGAQRRRASSRRLHKHEPCAGERWRCGGPGQAAATARPGGAVSIGATQLVCTRRRSQL
eukprot:scaffold2643_cov387-Prasinococcus_capsulatus_cf.AAC.2